MSVVNIRIQVSVSTGRGNLGPLLFSQPFERKIICLLRTFHLANLKEVIKLLFLACCLPVLSLVMSWYLDGFFYSPSFVPGLFFFKSEVMIEWVLDLETVNSLILNLKNELLF